MADKARTVQGLIAAWVPSRGRMARLALLTLAAGAVCGAVIVVGGRSEPAVSAIPAMSAPTVGSASERNGPEALLVRTMREINANRLVGAQAQGELAQETGEGQAGQGEHRALPRPG